MKEMFLKIWSYISYLGVKPELPDSEKRNIIITNRIVLILFALSMIFSVITMVQFSMGFLAKSIVVGYSICLFVTILLNWLGYTVVCRVLLSIFLPVYTIFASIYFKLLNPQDIQDYQFYASRIINLVFAVFPLIYFDLKSRVPLTISLLGGLSTIIFFDKIHSMFGVGYYDLGFSGDRYPFINVVTIMTYLLFLGAIIFLKRLIEEYETKNRSLIKTLKNKNDNLNLINSELTSSKEQLLEQKEELNAQKEELKANRDTLVDLNKVIDEQKSKLEVINKDLQMDLENKNKNLLSANKELVRNNNELRQFSYTISHNLRGPIASIIGLTELLAEKEIDTESKDIVSFIKHSTNSLDDTIRDLTKVLDMRNKQAEVRENVALDKEIEKIKLTLDQEIKDSGVQIETDFEQNYMYCARAIIHSILFNLVSNAIKFRSHEREPKIQIKTHAEDNNIVISVKDNGLGMDLDFFGKDLFKMYKRFHLHTEGRGLGLYLTKLQVELLDGQIDIESKLNKGTEFIIQLPVNAIKMLLDNESAKVEYLDKSQTIIFTWKKSIKSDEYRNTLQNNMDILANSTVKNWISDIRLRGDISVEDLNWMFKNLFSKAHEIGVEYLALVDNNDEDYRDSFRERANGSVIMVEFFDDLQDAKSWINSSNNRVE